MNISNNAKQQVNGHLQLHGGHEEDPGSVGLLVELIHAGLHVMTIDHTYPRLLAKSHIVETHYSTSACQPANRSEGSGANSQRLKCRHTLPFSHGRRRVSQGKLVQGPSSPWLQWDGKRSIAARVTA